MAACQMMTLEDRAGSAQTVHRMMFCLRVSKILKTPGADRRCLRKRVLAHGYQASLHDLTPAPEPRSQTELLSRSEQYLRQGIRACCVSDAKYPDRLRQTASCPLVLYYRGKNAVESWNKPLAITVIGTRSPTAYGRAVTRRIVPKLCFEQSVIISGLARGIDGLAHQITLANGGVPVAVVAQGVDVVYPACHADLMDQVAGKGVIISEHEPGTKPRRGYFPARNRILSGLCDVVAVMEAARNSGTLITAGFAADQGRDVFAVPGSILMRTSEGCHQLLREGAGLLTDAQDLLPALRIVSDGQSASQTADSQKLTAIAADDLALLRQLAGVTWRVDEIARQFAWTVRKTESWLSQQELAGHVYYDRGRFTLTDEVLFCI